MTFDPWILLLMLLVFGVSVGVFVAHVMRWTRNPWWFGLREWAARNEFAIHGERRAAVPVPLAGLTLPPPVARVLLEGRRTVVLQMGTPAPVADPSGGAPPVPRLWNVLVREIDADWPATALRPVWSEQSLVDLFALTSFPALMASERFTEWGTDPSAARALAKSHVAALLPKDVGLVLHGRRLVLDFSGRAFDGIELSRAVGLAEQVVAHLPVRGK
ncbi:MAG: hypothetical protein ACAI43_09800 [Phycisphaerae bacterium]|nr:hypothetical protein [Tepidisphaeraceae bacterium]